MPPFLKRGSRVIRKCDDGNTATESECAYGTASCTLCKADCSDTLSLTGGTGQDCLEGVRCTQDRDCEHGLVCGADRKCGPP